ncbi:NAD(P)-binding protein, partial [Coniochaeta ligniaria NRRL 30616]
TADDVASRFHSEIKDKTFLITGCGLASLGQHLAWTIARHEPKLIILCGRSDVRLRLLASNLRHRNPGLNVRHEVFDLADLSQVRKAAERINAVETVDVIICNAGIMLHPLRKTVDGIESHFGINSTSHFVLVNMLLPKMMANGGGRIVTTSSGAYRYAGIRWDDPNHEVPDEYIPGVAYASSKTADLLFAAALAHRYGSKGIIATSVDVGGGVAETNLATHLTDAKSSLVSSGILPQLTPSRANFESDLNVPPRTKAEACASQLVGALDPAIREHNGAFLLFGQPIEPAVDHAKGEENERLFWELSEKLAKKEF